MRWILTCKGCTESTGMPEWASFYDGCSWTSCCSMSLYTIHLLYVSLRGLYISVAILFHNNAHICLPVVCVVLSSLSIFVSHLTWSFLNLISVLCSQCFGSGQELLFQCQIACWVCTLLIVAQVWRCLLCRVSQVWQTWEEATSPGRRVDFLSNSPKLKKRYPDIRYRICPYHDV